MVVPVPTVRSPSASASTPNREGDVKGECLVNGSPMLASKRGRCRRLNKECRQPAVHRRQSTRKQPGSKAARLEEKLEDLVSLLRAGVQPPGANPINLLLGQFGQPADLPASQTALSPPDSLDAALGNAARNVYAIPSNPSDANTPDAGGHTAVIPFTSPSEPTVLQAEEYLTLFQNQLLPYFPCVYIPPGTSAQQLRCDRPFTWLCIMAVTCRSAVQRRGLYQKIKDITAQQMVHNSLNTDIDILLGLLIYLGWFVYLTCPVGHGLMPQLVGRISKYTTRPTYTSLLNSPRQQYMSSASKIPLQGLG